MGKLEGKTLVVLGDSLVRGGRLPEGAAWPYRLADEERMALFNYGVNGNTVAYVEGHSEPMVRRFKAMQPAADYVVLLGGANDKRLNVPIGEKDSMSEDTFIGALRLLAAGLIEKYPKARLLFMTNYNRRPKPNALGLCDRDYVDAMLAVAAEYAIPCFDNYRSSGISFRNPAHRAWIDEGAVNGGEANYHFSSEAYQWLVPKYKALLESL